MGNNTDLKTIIMRHISNLFLGYPEFAFFAKIVGGVFALGIAYWIFSFFI